MRLIIDIPEDIYNHIIVDSEYFTPSLVNAFKNGTPIPDNATKGEWVDVSERLPELKQRILVSYETMDDGKKVDVTTYDKYGFLIGKAQAWMPLPKPYQKGGK